MSAPSSAASAALISDSPELGFDTPSSVRATLGAEESLSGSGREPRSTKMWQPFAQNQRDELRLLTEAGALAAEPGMKQQTFLAFMPHRTLMEDGTVEEGFAERPVIDALHQPTGNKEPLIVSTSSAEASPARTSASPADEPDLQESDPPSSSSSHESLSLFAPAGFSSRTYPDSFPLTVDAISPSFSRRWPSSGMAFAGECWTLDSSESPKDGVECSLSDILEPEVPSRFYLSSKAARGILNRAVRREKTLPDHLRAALETVAQRVAPDTTSTTRPTSLPTTSERAKMAPASRRRT